jgi:hypothetical protein
MNNLYKYSVEFITDKGALTEALCLRYNIYKTTFPLLTAHHMQPYEWDEFDVRSIHLGLYYNDNNNKKLAGYCRLVLPEFFINDFAYLLVTNHAGFNKNIYIKERMVFMKQLVNDNDRNKINLFCSNLETLNKPYIETSRFMIDEEHRSAILSVFFVSGMIAASKYLDIHYCFFACRPHHIAFYNRFGFYIYPDLTPIDNEIYGRQYVIFGTDFSVASSFENLIGDYQLQLEKENRISFRKAA